MNAIYRQHKQAQTLKFLEVALFVFSGLQQARNQKSSNVFPKTKETKYSTKWNKIKKKTYTKDWNFTYWQEIIGSSSNQKSVLSTLSRFFTKHLGFYKGDSSPQIQMVQWRSFCSYNLIKISIYIALCRSVMEHLVL